MFASQCSTLVLLYLAASLTYTSATETNTSFIAQGLTGTYIALPTVIEAHNPASIPIAQGKCPSIIKFTAYAFKNILRIAPNGLSDPTRKCTPAGGIDRSSIPLHDDEQMRQGGFSPQPGSKVRALHASIPQNMIQCPNDIGLPFSSINLASVKDYVIPMLVSTLTEIGLPKAFIRDAFGGVKTPVTEMHPWYKKNNIALKRKVTTLLSSLSRAYYMHLKRLHRPSIAFIDKTSVCPFLGGAIPPAEIKQNMQKLLLEIVLLTKEIELMPMQFTSAQHFLTDSHCKSSTNRPHIHSIKLNYEFPLKKVPGVYGNGVILPVDVNGIPCASMHMCRFTEADNAMQHLEIGRTSRLLAKKVLHFLVNNAPPHTYNDPSLRRFAVQFPLFENRLREMRFKSSIFIARMNMSSCSGFDRTDAIDLIVAKKPSSFFYCNGFTDKSMDASHPCYQHLTLKKWGLVTKEDSMKDRNASTVFLNTIGKARNCIYDSSESSAYKFRNAFFKLQNSLQPSPEDVIEMSPEPSFAPASIDVPVTIPMSPKRGKACFPAHAMVTLRSGRKVRMSNLKLGDEVQVSSGVFSPVILFTHATDAIMSEMVSITTTSGAVSASPAHLLKVRDGHCAAGLLRVGDFVWVMKNGKLVLQTIRHIERKIMRGLYNPHTTEGTILVGSGKSAAVLASSYTTAVNPAMAHAAITPLRLMQSLFGITVPAISRLFPHTTVSGREKYQVMGHKNCLGDMRNILKTFAACRMQPRNDACRAVWQCGFIRSFLYIGQLLVKS